MVELNNQQEGQLFTGALVRLQDRRRICGKKLAFFKVRQAPTIEYDCCVSGDETLVTSLKKSKFMRQPGTFIVIAGTKKHACELQITDFRVYQKSETTEQQHQKDAPCLYLTPVVECLARHQVLEEAPGNILQRILEYVPSEDWQTSVLPVCRLWSSVALPLLQVSYQRVEIVNLRLLFYNIFQSARHTDPVFRPEGSFQNQEEYSELMLAGAHLCDLSLHNNNATILRGVYIQKKTCEALRLLLPEGHSRHPSKMYSIEQWNLVKAACIQLSQLNLQDHREHIRGIGYTMHNSPPYHTYCRDLTRKARVLRAEGLLCDEMENALPSVFGMDWFWEPLPNERR